MSFLQIFRYASNYTWWNLRFFGILSAPALFFELELFFLVQALTLFHARLGINNICKDYLHNPLLQVLYFSMFRILVIELININLNFWY